MTARSPALIEAALIDLLIAAAPFRAGRGMADSRTRLGVAIACARRALSAADFDGVTPDWQGLKRLADEADREAKTRPGYRADLEG